MCTLIIVFVNFLHAKQWNAFLKILLIKILLIYLVTTFQRFLLKLSRFHPERLHSFERVNRLYSKISSKKAFAKYFTFRALLFVSFIVSKQPCVDLYCLFLFCMPWRQNFSKKSHFQINVIKTGSAGFNAGLCLFDDKSHTRLNKSSH